MASLELTDENFRQTYTQNNIVILDFWAEWCGPCKSFAPVFEEVSEENPDVVFGKVNIEEQEELKKHFDIRSIPTIIVIRDQMELLFQPGALSGDQLRELVKKVKEVDMDEFRKAVAEEEAKLKSDNGDTE